jgi:hypothetical protein
VSFLAGRGALWLALLALLLSPAGSARAATPFAQHEKLALRAAAAERKTVGQYEKVELTLDLAADYDNPFDPAQMTSPRRSPRHRAKRRGATASSISRSDANAMVRMRR